MILGIDVDTSYLYQNVNSGGYRMNRNVCTTSNVIGTGATHNLRQCTMIVCEGFPTCIVIVL